MQCQQCQSELLPGARYCHSCAWEVQPQCPSCRTANPPGSKFCFNCGTDLEPESLTSEIDTGQASSPPATLVCPRCHQRNDPAATYCYSCGLPLDSAPNASIRSSRNIAAFAMGQPGGFWIRFLAYLIDALILIAVFAIVWPLVSGESLSEYWSADQPTSGDFSEDFWGDAGLSGGDWFDLALNLVYYTGSIGFWATTLGKRPFRLYVVRTDGSKVGLGRAMARYFAYILSAITLGIGFIMIGLRSDKRGLHDLICDTVVIRRQG